MATNTFAISFGVKDVKATFFCRKNTFVDGLLDLNTVLMRLNAQVVRSRWFFQPT